MHTLLPAQLNNDKNLQQALEMLCLTTFYKLEPGANLYQEILQAKLWTGLEITLKEYEQLVAKQWSRITRLIAENEFNDLKQVLINLESDSFNHTSFEQVKNRISHMAAMLHAPMLDTTPSASLQSFQSLLIEWFDNQLQRKILKNNIQSTSNPQEKKNYQSRLLVLETFNFDEQHAYRLLDLICPEEFMRQSRQTMARHSQEFYELVEKYQTVQYNLFSKDIFKFALDQQQQFDRENKQKLAKLESLKNQNVKINNRDKILKRINIHETEFSVNEQRALNALVILMDRALDRDELKFVDEANKAFLKVKTTDYYNAFGLTKIPKGSDGKLRYSGGDLEQAQLGLYELMDKWFIMQYNETTTNARGQKVEKTHKYTAPLIMPASVEMTSERITYADQQKTRVISNGYINLFIDKVFFNGLDKKYFLIPTEINKQIRYVLNGKKSPSPAIGHFIKYLHYIKSNTPTNKSEISYNKLIEVLHLNNYQRQGKRGRIKERIRECFEIGQKMGLLKSVEIGVNTHGSDKYILHLQNAKQRITEAQDDN